MTTSAARRIAAGKMANVVLLLALAGPGAALAQELLRVEAVPVGENTGTMHYHRALTITLGDSEPLRIGDAASDDPEAGVPIPGPQFRLDRNHHVLFGWSSYGAGMQTLHALLVTREGRKLSLRELAINSDRPRARVIVRPRRGALRIGFEQPTGFLHSEEEWSIRVAPGGPRLEGSAQLLRLRAEPYDRREGDSEYAPMRRETPVPGRVIWIDVDGDGFRLPRLLRASDATGEER